MSSEIDQRMQALDDEYTAAVNAAIERGRFDVVEQLADEYPVAFAEALTSAA